MHLVDILGGLILSAAPALVVLGTLLGLVLDDPLDCELRLLLRAEDVPAPRVVSSDDSMRLGLTSWLCEEGSGITRAETFAAPPIRRDAA